MANNSFNPLNPLFSQVLTKARENSATKTYSSYFEKWKNFATQFLEVNIGPANAFNSPLHDTLSLKRETFRY